MGDLIHMMYVVANTPGRHDVFITDRRDLHSDGFISPVEQTIKELRAVLMYQDYVNSVQVYKDEDAINLNLWRSKAYSDNWTVLLSKMFNVPVVSGPWIKVYPGIVHYNKIIHCSIPGARRGNWDGVNLHGGVFMGSIAEYNSFNRPEIPLVTPHSLGQVFSLIAGCGEFIGNQSLPLAIAHSLDVPRTGVLNSVDQAAYVGEEKIFQKFKYVL